MNSQFLSTVKLLVTAGWRRRHLLTVPVLVMLPLSLIWALYGPKVYVAKSLMLLQEATSTNPLAKDGGGQTTRIQERIAGLQALLKSDRVLGNVYRDLSADTPGSRKDMAVWMRDFSPHLSVELIGSDFLEFRLKGSNPRGMGKTLEAVTSRFLEALQPEQNAQFASQVLLDRRREEMEGAERILAQFRQRLAERLPRGLSEPEGRLGDLRKSIEDKAALIELAAAEIDKVRVRLSGGAPAASRIDQEIVRVRAELAVLEGRGAAAAADVARLKGRLGDLQTLQTIEQQKSALDGEVKELSRQADALTRTIRQLQPVGVELSRLEREAALAKEAFEEYARRYQRVAQTRTGGILNAPDRIKLIDAPRDPEFPANSAVRLAIVSLLGSIMLGLGLSVGAELVDQRVRSAEEASAACGLPVVARLA